jgi:hypothetical protein
MGRGFFVFVFVRVSGGRSFLFVRSSYFVTTATKSSGEMAV